MVRTFDLTDRISELLKRSTTLTFPELEEIVRYETDARLSPVDRFNIGLIFHQRHEYLDALRCFADALGSYETADEKNLYAYTLAHLGDVMKELGNIVVRDGKLEEGIGMYHYAALFYGEALEHLDKIPLEALPATLANAAAMFYNIADYPQALQICATYQTLDPIRQFRTEKTDEVVDSIFTKAGSRIKPAGQG